MTSTVCCLYLISAKETSVKHGIIFVETKDRTRRVLDML